MREIDDNNIISEEENNLDSPIFIFPDDITDDDTDNINLSSDDDSAPKLFGGSGGLSFDHVDAVKKEKEFVYMPFLDIPDEPEDDDIGESSALSFSKVKAVKKENEFIFMPFLNDADSADNEENKEEKKYHLRPDGTLFDEGLILMPLSPLDDDDEEDADDQGNADSSDDDENDDIGIYVTDASSDGYIPRTPKAPNRSNAPGKGGGKKKRPPQHGAHGKKGGKKGGKGMPSADEQFRAAMMNINPEIRRAAMRDPIQRAALEQAVRIALVQQAAQEAVAMTTGSPGGYGNNFGQPQPFANNQVKRGKKRPAPTANPFQTIPQPTAVSTPASPLASSVRGFSFGGFSSSPSEFNVGDSTASSVNTQSVGMAAANQTEAADYNPNNDTPITPTPDIIQDPILGSLSASSNQGIPNSQQDPAMASLTRNSSGGTKSINALSPAAVRAAMRAGVNLTNLPNNSSSPSSALPQNSLSAQKAKLQEAVDTRRSGCLIWIIVSFIVFFIGLIAIAIWPSLSTEMKYQQASTMMANGEYLQASKVFDKLDDYKDSETKANEAVYTYASSILNSGAYETALELFNSISTYSNSGERIAECRYALGKMHIDNGNYDEAYDHLRHIPRYADAGELAMDANYKCATELYNEGNYESARIRFNMFPDYQDSFSMWQVSQYKCAEQLMTAEDFENAYMLFTELGDYINSPYRAAIAHYDMLLNGASATVEEVKSTLQTLQDYSTDPDALTALRSPIFTPIKLLGRWESGEDNSYMEYKIEDNVHKLVIFIDGIDTTAATYENVKFDENTLYYQSVDGNTSIIRIESFENDSAAEPDAVNFSSFAANNEYVFLRAN